MAKGFPHLKNTFIEEQEEENSQERPIHALGVNTCTARLTTNPCKFADLYGDGDMSEASTPSICGRTNSATTATSEAEIFVGTPTGSESSFRFGDVEPSMNVVAPITLCAQQDLPTSAVPGRQIWLKIPVELPYDIASSVEDFNYIVTNSLVNADSGCASIDVSVTLNSTRKILPLAALVPDCRTYTGASHRSRVKAQDKSLASTHSSDQVCCHWKNKGWCKYQECCKFQHPAHKRGVGSTKRT